MNLVDSLLERGADPNHVGEHKVTPLLLACGVHYKCKVDYNTSSHIAKSLLKFGAKFYYIGYSQDVGLHSAACAGDVELVKALLNAGVDYRLKDLFNKTALECACGPEVKRILKEAEGGPRKKGIIFGSATAALGTAIATYLFVNGIIAIEAMSIALAVVAIAAVALAVGGVTYKASQPRSKVSAAQTLENQSSMERT